MLNMDSYNSFEKIALPPTDKSDTDDYISIKEEESCDTKNKSETESTTSEATKKRIREEEQ